MIIYENSILAFKASVWRRTGGGGGGVPQVGEERAENVATRQSSQIISCNNWYFTVLTEHSHFVVNLNFLIVMCK